MSFTLSDADLTDPNGIIINIIYNWHSYCSYSTVAPVLEVGFEPTRPKPFELESNPLDHSGTPAHPSIEGGFDDIRYTMYVC